MTSEEEIALRDDKQALEERLKKDSHSSHPSLFFECFHHRPSLRKKSGKKPGRQAGHPGSALKLSPDPDQVFVHLVLTCWHCQAVLCAVRSLQVERRQEQHLTPKRVVVGQHVHQKCCSSFLEITSAAFPQDVRTPVGYEAELRAIGV